MMKTCFLIFAFSLPVLVFSQNNTETKVMDTQTSPIVSVMTKANSTGVELNKKAELPTNTVVTKMEKSNPNKHTKSAAVSYKVGDVVNGTVVTTMVRSKE